jgi:hypothetical protein
MREDKKRMENGEWRTVAQQFSILHSSFFLLVWEVQMTKYKVPHRRRGRKENLKLGVLGAFEVQFYFSLTQPSANQSAV